MPDFGVRVSVMFHLIFVNIIISSVWVAQWLPFWERAAHPICHMFFSYFYYFLFKLDPVLVLMAGFGL